MQKHIVYILLGSNMDKPSAQLATARKHIRNKIGNILQTSSLYQTKAWGITDQPDFLNQVLKVNSKFSPEEIMRLSLDIEKKMGRVRTFKNAPRTIDIDILFFDKIIVNTQLLTIPHPRITERRFVLTPLNEMSPRFKHPVLRKEIHELYRQCKDKLAVEKLK